MNPFMYIYIYMYVCMYVCIGICERQEKKGGPVTPAVGCRVCRAEPQGGGVGDRRRS
ncbi:hypothetical protein HanOQP8_Chr05g0174341 [Helianthus annuus]|nr:hypothetical protein HanOQP8_Chr05g0174341 [Helianthus annuus]